MKKKLIYIAIAVSLLCNVVFIGFFIYDKVKGTSNGSTTENVEDSPFADLQKRQTAAQAAVRKLVCDNLYYPNTYDPISTTVDSAFLCPLTDAECVKAADELIDMEAEYASEKETYEDNAHQFKEMGYDNFFRDLRVARDNAAAKMKELEPKIERRRNIIKNRDASKDGKFIGWQVAHRYRAANSNDIVSISEVLFILDPLMQQYYFQYSLNKDDKKNLEEIKKCIEKNLGTYVDE